jgi:hypothetical protein
MKNSSINSDKVQLTVQEQTKNLIAILLERGFNADLLKTLDFQQLQRAVDTTKGKTHSLKPVKVTSSTGVHIRFIDYIQSVENNRLTYDEVIEWLMSDMSKDNKTWFGQDFQEVKNERQLYEMGLNPEFNEKLYLKMFTRAKNRVNTHLTHDSDNATTSNQTVNIELKKRGLDTRCNLVKSGSIPVAIELK